MSIKNRIVMLKVVYGRNQVYVRMIEFLMIATLFLKSLGTSAKIYIPLMIVGLIVLAVIDLKLIMPSELKYLWTKNPVFNELRSDIKEIKEMVKKK